VTELPVSTSGQTAEQVARLCAEEAARTIMGRYGRREEVLAKGRGNFLTETDLAVHNAVVDILTSEYPDHRVLSEEAPGGDGADGQSGWLWVVDPIDGTHNYSQGVPHFCFTIALCFDGEPIVGLTRAPMTGEEFFAREGGDLRVNGEPASISTTPSLAESVLGMDLGYDDARAAGLLSLLAELWPGVQAVRVMGSAALGFAFAACGRFDLYVHHFLYPWDSAAGILLVREGGGLVLDREGGPATIYSDALIAGAPGAVQDFLRLTREKPRH
jgi:myo-inositol-1(or 4)-monophosphatase